MDMCASTERGLALPEPRGSRCQLRRSQSRGQRGLSRIVSQTMPLSKRVAQILPSMACASLSNPAASPTGLSTSRSQIWRAGGVKVARVSINC